MIKRLLLAALLGVIALPASAAMNIQQRGDGTASWIGRTTGTFSNCVGGTNLRFTVPLADGKVTDYQPVNITNAVIKGAWGVSRGTSAGTSHVKIYVNQLTHALQFYDTGSSTVATDARLTFSTASAGTTARISTVADVLANWGASGATRLASNTAIEGAYIAVSSDGGGTTTNASANILIRVCPR